MRRPPACRSRPPPTATGAATRGRSRAPRVHGKGYESSPDDSAGGIGEDVAQAGVAADDDEVLKGLDRKRDKAAAAATRRHGHPASLKPKPNGMKSRTLRTTSTPPRSPQTMQVSGVRAATATARGSGCRVRTAIAIAPAAASSQPSLLLSGQAMPTRRSARRITGEPNACVSPRTRAGVSSAWPSPAAPVRR